LDGDTRTKAKVVGSYVYEKTPSYEIRIEPVVNSAYEILIGKFTSGAGGAGYATVSGRSDSGININDNLVIANNLTVDTNLIKTDSANNRVGINKTTPAKTLDVGCRR